MPLWLRRTTFNMMKEFYDKEAEEAEKNSKGMHRNGKDIARPNISRSSPSQPSTPTYTSRAPKK